MNHHLFAGENRFARFQWRERIRGPSRTSGDTGYRWISRAAGRLALYKKQTIVNIFLCKKCLFSLLGWKGRQGRERGEGELSEISWEEMIFLLNDLGDILQQFVHEPDMGHYEKNRPRKNNIPVILWISCFNLNSLECIRVNQEETVQYLDLRGLLDLRDKSSTSRQMMWVPSSVMSRPVPPPSCVTSCLCYSCWLTVTPCSSLFTSALTDVTLSCCSIMTFIGVKGCRWVPQHHFHHLNPTKPAELLQKQFIVTFLHIVAHCLLQGGHGVSGRPGFPVSGIIIIKACSVKRPIWMKI